MEAFINQESTLNMVGFMELDALRVSLANLEELERIGECRGPKHLLARMERILEVKKCKSTLNHIKFL